MVVSMVTFLLPVRLIHDRPSSYMTYMYTIQGYISLSTYVPYLCSALGLSLASPVSQTVQPSSHLFYYSHLSILYITPISATAPPLHAHNPTPPPSLLKAKEITRKHELIALLYIVRSIPLSRVDFFTFDLIQLPTRESLDKPSIDDNQRVNNIEISRHYPLTNFSNLFSLFYS